MGENPLNQQGQHWPQIVAKIAAMALFGLSALRLIKPEGPVVAVVVAAIAPLLVFGSAAVATYAIRSRQWFGFGCMFVLVILQGFWLLADLGPGSSDKDTAAAYEPVVIATANVSSENVQVDELLAGLAESDAGVPDVIALQEVTPEVAAQLAASTSWDTYPYRYLDPLPGYHGSAILSRFELIDPRVEWVDGWPMARAELATPSEQIVSILNVHVVAPLSSEGSARWKRQINELGDLAFAAEQQGVALILAGDFNATIQHPTLARLTHSDALLSDVHLQAGSGLGLTWPDLPLGASLLRLDRVLINQRVTAISIQTIDAQGSDHRGLVATLAIPQN